MSLLLLFNQPGQVAIRAAARATAAAGSAPLTIRLILPIVATATTTSTAVAGGGGGIQGVVAATITTGFGSPPPPPGMAACDLGAYLGPGQGIRGIAGIRYITRIGFDPVLRFSTGPSVVASSQNISIISGGSGLMAQSTGPTIVFFPVNPRVRIVEIDVVLSDGTLMTCVDVLSHDIV